MNAPSSSDMPFKGNTVIGNDVWLGQNAVILPGVHIGDGAIIGANSIVGSDVEPYTIVVGNPAKELRKRFDKELIDMLLAFKWWDKSVEEINDLIPILTCSDLSKVKPNLIVSHPNSRRSREMRLLFLSVLPEVSSVYYGIYRGCGQ